MDDFNDGLVLPTLIRQLKGILDQYPDDGQILKEVIQNAEDAGATRVVFLIDNSTYGTDPSRLYDRRMEQFQGPALFVYNDAVFDDNDWRGIRLLHESIKENDPMKVGRFGLGFKSVFHMTDLPSIFSDKGIAFIDPHMKYFNKLDSDGQPIERTSSFLFHLERDREVIKRCSHQFQPFIQSLFGISEKTFSDGHFRGTVFRFPLRKDGQSDLSSTQYNTSKLKNLIHSLTVDAHGLLLFLKNLECIQVFEKTSSSDTDPQKLLEIKISPPFLNMLRKTRRDFQENVFERKSNWTTKRAFASAYPMAIDVTKRDDQSPSNSSSSLSSTLWFVSQYHAGKEDASNCTVNRELGYLPIVGTAVRVNPEDDVDLCSAQPEGHIFCFLPLPLEKKSPTGFRFHVHGCFAIDQNRRHIKWPTADQTDLTDPALLWNTFLVNNILPKTAEHLIVFITKLQQHSDSSVTQLIPPNVVEKLEYRSKNDPDYLARLVYAIFPDPITVTPQWRKMSDVFVKDTLLRREVWYSRSVNRWLLWKDIIFDDLGCDRSERRLIRSVLLKGGRNLAVVPTYVFSLLPSSAHRVQAQDVASSLSKVQETMDLTDDDRKLLLAYLLAELVDLKALIDLDLLPLEDGKWTRFKPASKNVEKIFIESNDHPRSLLPGLEGRFIKANGFKDKCEKLAGITQLMFLKADEVCQMLNSLLSRWKEKDRVSVAELTKTGLDRNWLRNVWRYINTHFRMSLYGFNNLPIMPISNDAVIPLSNLLPVIARKINSRQLSSSLPDDVVTVCRTLGIYVIDEVAPEVSEHPEIWDNYVLKPTAQGFLKALHRLQSKRSREVVTEDFIEHVTNKCRKSVVEFLAKGLKGSKIEESIKTVLKGLPIFVTAQGSGGEDSRFVSIDNVNVAAPNNSQLSIPVTSPVMLLNLEREYFATLAALLDVRPSNVPNLLAKVYLPAIQNSRYSVEQVQKLMEFVCENLKAFERISDQPLSQLSKEIKFLSNGDGRLVRPCDLFDPHEKLLEKLFRQESVFPVGNLAKIKYRESLLSMGLKTSENVTAADVMRVTSKLSSTNGDSGNEIAVSLMSLLNSNTNLLHASVDNSQMTLRQKLTSVQWIPVHKERPKNFPQSLKFASEQISTGLAAPSAVRGYGHVYLVGSIRPLVKTDNLAALAKEFKWNADPDIEDVAQHLKNIVVNYCPAEKVFVQNMVSEIYRFLNNNTKYIDQWLTLMHGQKWIWNDDGFGDSKQIVTETDVLDLRPYRYRLPTSFAHFKALWGKCDLQRKSNLSEVLQAMHEAHTCKDTTADVQHDIQLSVNILNYLAEQKMNSMSPQTLLVPINTIDESFSMKPLQDCAYCDKEWYQKGFDSNDVDEEIFLIHDKIPLKTAENLHIPSLISRTLGVEALDIGYGQTEPLTRRLKSILGDYSDGLAVLKELIQNADDAGATEVRFLYDQRSNGDCVSILLDQGMKTLQGPAFWAYNNAVFTDEDFENIVKLSGATKETCGDKIGRFGLGFNAVYNLTDVPSFISRQSIVFFDPHLRYLGRALQDKSKPGIKLNLKTHRNRIQRLVDQFKPFNGIFDCDLSVDSTMESYEGTLFRFPLRTSEQAARSEIRQVCYSDDEMMKLLQVLETASSHLLLFTQNVQKVTVFYLADDCESPRDMTTLFSVSRHLVRSVRNIVPEIPIGERQQSKAKQIGASSFLAQANRVLSAYRQKSSGKEAALRLESTVIYQVSIDYNSATSRRMLEEKGNEKHYWMVSSCLGTGSSLSMALEDPTLIPVGGVAARLVSKDRSQFSAADYETCSDVSGIVFCFMPLPIRYPLPVHINGYFSVHSSRTSLYEPTSLDKVDRRATWNNALIEDAVSKSYCNLLEDLRYECSNENCFSVWPSLVSLAEASSLTKRLFQSLYRRMCTDDELKLVRVDGVEQSWTYFSRCRMLTPQFRDDQMSDVALRVLKVLKPEGVQVVDIPARIITTIQQTEVASVVNKQLIDKESFYRRFFLPRVTSVETFDRDTLILHCLFDDKLKTCLKEFVCIPASPDGTFCRRIGEMVDPASDIACLFDEDEGVFPSWEPGVADDADYLRNINEKLVSLGMKKDSLSWKELADRCRAVQSNPDTAKKRTKVITGLMNQNLKHGVEPSPCVLDTCRGLKFLLKAERPTQFPLKWKADELPKDALISVNDGYLNTSDQKFLVCSSFPLIDESRSFSLACNELKNCFGLIKKPVHFDTVLNQIEELIVSAENNKGAKKAGSLSLFCQIYEETFKFLDRYVKKHQQQVEERLSPLAQLPCILIDQTLLMLPSRCAFTCENWSDSLLPHLALVPASYAKSFRELYLAIGVKQKFDVSDYKMLLAELSDRSQSRKLSKQELNMTLHVINQCIFNEVQKLNNNPALCESLLDNLHIPNAADRLCPARSLCFNNCPWLVDPSDVNFCNTRIPHPVAEAIGIKTLRQNVLAGRRIAKPFGQKEPLVRRIRRILESYPFSEDILKEMLQNADDSGATQIRFILDTRNLSNERVFADSWKALQGPALCVYNNCSFTEADLDGIQNLGEGSKGDDPTKTGQYGVGFNIVYHVTDVPTFLTSVQQSKQKQQLVLCAFDPNCKYVPGANSHDSGGMYEVNESLKEQFRDVFEGYLLERYDVTEKGTMFRLPLRDAKMANASEISPKIHSVKTISDMFDTFRVDVMQALLFVNSVEEVHLEKIDDDNQFTEMHRVTLTLSSEDKRKRTAFQKNVRENAAKLRRGELSLEDVDMLEVSYEVIIEDSDGSKDVWDVVQRFGFEDTDVIPPAVKDAHRRGDLGCLPVGGVAYLKKSSQNRDKHNNKLFCFLPLPVSLGKFPVSVNGHFVLDHESRRNIWTDDKETYKYQWNKCLMEGVVAPAFSSVLIRMRDSLKASDDLPKASGLDLLRRYFDAFPTIETSSVPLTEHLARALYKYISDENKELLPLHGKAQKLSNLKWMSPLGQPKKKPYFDDLKTQLSDEQKRELTTFYRSGASVSLSPAIHQQKTEPSSPDVIVRNTLLRCGFILFNCPMRVIEQFERAQVGVERISPEAVLDFFGQYQSKNSLCKLKTVPIALSDTVFENIESVVSVLKYCMRFKECKSKLHLKPLLVTADLHLRVFDDQDKKFVSNHFGVAPHALDLFVHPEIQKILKLDPVTDPGLCQPFTSADFANLLPRLLPSNDFNGEDKVVSISLFKEVLKKIKLDFKSWLTGVWNFIASFIPAPFIIFSSLSHEKPQTVDLAAILSPLSSWCLLPIVCKSSEYLLPVCQSSAVVHFHDVLGDEVERLLSKMGVARPISEYMIGIIASHELSSFMFGNSKHPSRLLSALQLLERLKISVDGLLDNREGIKVLHYFSNHLTDIRNISETIGVLKRLPLYVTVYEKQSTLSCEQIYVLPRIPEDGLESWSNERRVIFLKQEESVKELLEFMNCKTLSVTEVYCSFIFKHFRGLPGEAQLAHLTFVRDHTKKLKADSDMKEEFDALCSQLRELKFLPSSKDKQELVSASQYYDKDVNLFKVMLTEKEFPPVPFNDDRWTEFLRVCGLISKVSQDMFVTFALQVASSSDVNKEFERSEELQRHFMERDDLDCSFLDRVKNIAFIQPFRIPKKNEKLHPPFGIGSSRLIPFNGCALSKHHALVWTVQLLLPEEVARRLKLHLSLRGRENSQKIYEGVLTRLGVDVSPRVSVVAEHVNRLCIAIHAQGKQFFENEKLVDALIEVLKASYQFLNQCECLRTDAKSIELLQDTPCICIRETLRLLKPCDFAESMSDEQEVKPHLNKFPMELGTYIALFELLGTQKNPTIEQYARALASVHEETSGNKQMNVNEIRTVMNATVRMLNLISKSHDQPRFPTSLYLPNESTKLQLSSTLVFEDDTSLRPRLRQFNGVFLYDLSCQGLKDNVVRTSLLKMPDSLRPKFLSSMVFEYLEETGEDEFSDLADRIEKRLKSRDFVDALKRIVQHHLITEKMTTSEIEPEVKKAVDVSTRIRAVGRQRIVTYLQYDGEKIPYSEKQPDYFFSWSKENGVDVWKVHVTTCFKGDTGFYSKLAGVISKQSVGNDRIAIIVLQILDCQYQHINSVLSENKIPQIHRDRDASNYALVIGDFVPQHMHGLLIQNLYLFASGMLVAMETDDPLDRNEHGEATFIFVQIIELVVRDASSDVANTYRVKVSESGQEMKVKANVLFAFARPNCADMDSQASAERALVLQTSVPSNSLFDILNESSDFETIVKDLKKRLAEAWKLPEVERKRVIKRLKMAWHPDKNPERTSLCTRVFQLLQNLIGMLEAGRSIDDVNEDEAAGGSSAPSRQGTDFDDLMRRRAHTYYQQEHYWRERQSSSRKRNKRWEGSWGAFDNFYEESRLRKNPQSGEARRWLRQARFDMDAARGDLKSANEWCCQKCFQAADKALRAAQISRDINISYSSSSDRLQCTVDDQNLKDLARRFQQLVPSFTVLRYPDSHPFPKIPHDVIGLQTSTELIDLTAEIIEKCQEFIDRAPAAAADSGMS